MLKRLSVGLLAAGLLMGAGCRKDEPVAGVPPTVVKVARVGHVYSDSGAMVYSGNVTPFRQVDLAFKVGGYVDEVRKVPGPYDESVPIDAGARVSKGTVLARVREADYQAKVDGARADLARARAAQVDTSSRVRQAEASLREIGRGPATAQASIDELRAGLFQAQGALSESQTGVVQARADYDRASALLKVQSLTQSDYDAALARYRMAAAREDQARASVQACEARLASAGTGLAVSHDRVAESQATLGSSRAQVDSAGASVHAAEAALQDALVTMDDCSLRAPFDGIVVARRVDVGALMVPGTVAFTVADTHLVRVDFGVAASEMAGIHKGQTVSLTTEAVPEVVFPGTVSSIAPAADAKSRTFQVEISVRNGARKLRSGMIASLTLGRPADRIPILAVPLSAIVRSPKTPDGYAVVLVEDSSGQKVARVREVELGDALGNMVAVKHGIKEGDSIVVGGASLTVDGSPVRISE